MKKTTSWKTMVERLTLSLAGDSSPPQFKRSRFLQKLGHFPHNKTKAYINLNKSNSCVQTSVCQTSRNDMLIMKPAHIVTGYPISYMSPPIRFQDYLTCILHVLANPEYHTSAFDGKSQPVRYLKIGQTRWSANIWRRSPERVMSSW